MVQVFDTASPYNRAHGY